MRLTDPQYRDAIVFFLRLSGLNVREEIEADAFVVDFSHLDLDADAQRHVVRRMVTAWDQQRGTNAFNHATMDHG